MKVTMAALVLLGLVAGANAGAVELTADNFDSEVVGSGKGAFVKFLAPWWGHCKSMKPAWDKLGDAHKDSKTVLIGDVDCTTDQNKPLCSQYGVKGYPTIKYFTASTDPTGDKYEGGRDYDALAKFAEESLGPQCSLSNRDLCDEAKNKEIDSYIAMTPAERQAVIEEKDSAIKNAEETLDALLKSLQSQFEAGKEAKESAIAAATPGLSVLRMVQKGAEDDKKDEL